MDGRIIFFGGDGGALPRGSCKWEGPSSGMTHFSAAPPARSSTGRRIAASQAAGRDGARVVAGTRRRGGRAVQSWVKPEVDPPMGLRAAARVSFTVETTVLPSFALPRGSCKWEGFVLVLCAFSTAN
jgi:hypothetical protein